MKLILENKSPKSIAFIVIKDGIECPFIHLDDSNSIARTFLAYAQMLSDLEYSMDLFRESQNHLNDPIIYESLICSAILAYSRPFKFGNGRIVKKLLSDNVLNNTNFKSIHDQILELRDKFHAHADRHEYSNTMLLIALNHDDSDKSILDLYRGLTRAINLEPETVSNFIYTTEHVIDWLKLQLDKERQLILKNLKQIDIEELYDCAVDPNALPDSVQKIYLNFPF